MLEFKCHDVVAVNILWTFILSVQYLRANVMTAMKEADLREGLLQARPDIKSS